MEIKIGDKVKASRYYNTNPFSGHSIKSGIVIGIEKGAFGETVFVSEKDRVIKISSEYIEKK